LKVPCALSAMISALIICLRAVIYFLICISFSFAFIASSNCCKSTSYYNLWLAKSLSWISFSSCWFSRFSSESILWLALSYAWTVLAEFLCWVCVYGSWKILSSWWSVCVTGLPVAKKPASFESRIYPIDVRCALDLGRDSLLHKEQTWPRLWLHSALETSWKPDSLSKVI